MRDFNLEEAKAGKPVVTKDGKPVRIFAFDLKNEGFPIVGAIDYSDSETPSVWTEKGYVYKEIPGESKYHCNDLKMAPIKAVRWFNMYESDNSDFFLGSSSGYLSEEEAIKVKLQYNYIKTISIEVEL